MWSEKHAGPASFSHISDRLFYAHDHGRMFTACLISFLDLKLKRMLAHAFGKF